MPLSARELIDLVLQATVLLAASAVLVRGLIWLLRCMSPAAQRIAWLLVLVQGIVPVRLPVHVPWYAPGPVSPPMTTPTVAYVEPAPEPPAEFPGDFAVLDRTNPPVASPVAPAVDSSEASGEPEASRIGPLLPTAFQLLLVWVAGMVLMPAYGVLKYLRFLRRIRGKDFGEEAWTAQWRDLLAARGKTTYPVFRATRETGPALCRLPSGYAVLVPADVWRGLSVGQREGILRHELAHYERGDLWKSLLVRLVALPHWFNPLAWWAVRKFDECTEWLCDDAAAADRPEARDFAQALVRIGTLGSPQASMLNAARGRLFHRIRRLVAAEPREDSKMKKSLLIVVTSLLLLFGAVRIQLVAKEPAESPPAAEAATPATRTAPKSATLPPALPATSSTPAPATTVPAPKTSGYSVDAAGAEASAVSLPRLSRKRLLREQGYPEVFAIAFSPDGKVLASGRSDYAITLWDVASEKVASVLTGHRAFLCCVAFDPTGRVLASASADRTIRLWDVPAGKTIATLEGHQDQVRSVAFSPDGKLLASAGMDQTIRLWDVETRKSVGTLPCDANCVALSPDGRTLASGGGLKDKTVKLWDMEARKVVATLPCDTMCLAFSPDGKFLASGASGDDPARLWDAKTGKLVTVLKGWGIRFDAVESVAFSPNGKVLAAGTLNHGVELWEVATGKRLDAVDTGQGGSSLAFSPDGKLLAFGFGESEGGGGIYLWDVRPAAGPAAASPLAPPAAKSVAGIVVDPDGKPVERARVSAGLRSRPFVGPSTVFSTGRDGRFAIRDVPNLPLTLTAYLLPPLGVDTLEFRAVVDAEPGQTDVRIVLDPRLFRGKR